MNGVKGFGRLDLILCLIVALLLGALAVPVFGEYVNRTKVAQGIEDIDGLSRQIDAYRDEHDNRLPRSLDELPGAFPLDPWGNRYHYVRLSDPRGTNFSSRRNNRHGPLNTDFDLYSTGADGGSSDSLLAISSRDDIVRASNGAFIGLGEEF